MRVIVVGAGVIGLSCAVRLAECGLEVHVLARDLPLETTSAVAAAVWYPYRVAAAPDGTEAAEAARTLGWARATYAELARLAAAEPQTGVRMTRGVELLRQPEAQPWWRAAVPQLGHVPAGELPAGYRDGWRLSVPVADMGTYLPWLLGRLAHLGVTVTRRWLPSLPAVSDGPIIVNCTGLGAAGLAQDDSVYPVRGQVLRLERPDGLQDWLIDDSGPPDRPLYVVPRGSEVVVGGTADVGNYDRRADPSVSGEVLARATALVPALTGARILGHRVGLRPARPRVRLEQEVGTSGSLVHCYGHGGAGVTLSWGCADEVADLVASITGDVDSRTSAR